MSSRSLALWTPWPVRPVPRQQASAWLLPSQRLPLQVPPLQAGRAQATQEAAPPSPLQLLLPRWARHRCWRAVLARQSPRRQTDRSAAVQALHSVEHANAISSKWSAGQRLDGECSRPTAACRVPG